jgi:S-formylglutathione hydrolase
LLDNSLTCTENNASEKGGFQRWASELGLAIVFPDTSPRGTRSTRLPSLGKQFLSLKGVSIPGDSDSWDFGLGAGFYVNATTEGFKNHYRMYDYIAVELPNLVAAELPLDITRFSIRLFCRHIC